MKESAKKIGRTVLAAAAWLIIASGCASMMGIKDLSDVDFAMAEFVLLEDGAPASAVKPEGIYSLSIRAFDAKKQKIQDVFVNKQARFSIQNARAASPMAGGKKEFRFKMAAGSIALAEIGEVRLVVENLKNGTRKTLVYPLTWSGYNTVVLPPLKNGAGANATFMVALLDTAQLGGKNQGQLLLLKNQETGHRYVTAAGATVVANGRDGARGRDGQNGRDYSGRRGGNGGNGQNGGNGGNGGAVNFTGSSAALSMVNAITQPGAGGRGGNGGRGGRGLWSVISYSSAQRSAGDIESLEVEQDGRQLRGLAEADTTRQVTVRAKFHDGRDGERGQDGFPGQPGTSLKTPTALDFHEFSQFAENTNTFHVEMLR